MWVGMCFFAVLWLRRPGAMVHVPRDMSHYVIDCLKYIFVLMCILYWFILNWVSALCDIPIIGEFTWVFHWSR